MRSSKPRSIRGARFDTILRRVGSTGPRGEKLASRSELSAFLAGVERRAFKQAVFAVRDDEAALDIVQDAMLRLSRALRRPRGRKNWRRCSSASCRTRSATGSGARRCARCGPRCFRASRPGAARTTTRIRWTPCRRPATRIARSRPPERLERSQVIEIIEKEVSLLPARQREAFLLRYWEELDVAETAKAMGCSEGSVKTHCSRATHALAAALRNRGITL